MLLHSVYFRNLQWLFLPYLSHQNIQGNILWIIIEININPDNIINNNPSNFCSPLIYYWIYNNLLLDYNNLSLDFNNLVLDYNNPVIIYYYNPWININPSSPVFTCTCIFNKIRYLQQDKVMLTFRFRSCSDSGYP